MIIIKVMMMMMMMMMMMNIDPYAGGGYFGQYQMMQKSG